MHNLCKTRSGYLYPALKRNPNLFAPIYRLHSVTKTLDPDCGSGFALDELEEIESSKPTIRDAILSFETKESSTTTGSSNLFQSTVRISHPWPEWVGLMECLIKGGYLDGEGNPFKSKNEKLGPKEANSIRTACLNFGRDRFSLVRYFSKKDIQMIVECGCPSKDRKVVNSGKRLRAHVGIDERNVCSSCNLRGSCDRAFVKPHEDEDGRTVDVMRILLTYGLDPITGTVENKPCLNKMVKEAARRLLNQLVEYGTKELDSNLLKSKSTISTAAKQSPVTPHEDGQATASMKQGDWQCPKCNFLNFARNVRCLRCDSLFLDRLKQVREDQDHLPLKQGDWICDKCNFMNYAKNSGCRRCKEKPGNRQLNPGEWECESCYYINFRRNTVCLKCGHKPTSQADDLFLNRVVQQRQDQVHFPLKKGDWICGKCNFLNFGKNTNCRQCQEIPPRRQLNPGE